jgi:DNA polymerase-3 subunit gamma/tau
MVEETSRATIPPVEPASSTPPPTTAPLPVTLQQVRDSWPEILDLMEKEKRSAWMVVFPAQARAINGDVLTLTFPNEKDVAEFRQPPATGEGVSEHLRRAILDVLGIRVKFIAKVEATMANTAPRQAPGAAPVSGANTAPPRAAAQQAAPAQTAPIRQSTPAQSAPPQSAPTQQRAPQTAPAAGRPPQGQQTQQGRPSGQGAPLSAPQGRPAQGAPAGRGASAAQAPQAASAPKSAPAAAPQSAPQGRPAGTSERKLSDIPDSFAPPPDDYVEPIESDLEPVNEPFVARGQRPQGSGAPTSAPANRPAGRPTGAPASNPPGRPTGAPANSAPGRPTGAPANSAPGRPAGAPTGAPAAQAKSAPPAAPAGDSATDANGWAVASIPGAPTPVEAAATEAAEAAKPVRAPLVIDPTAAPVRPFGRPAAPPIPGEVQRYGESVVREVLGATFIEEEPVAPRVVPMPRND